MTAIRGARLGLGLLLLGGGWAAAAAHAAESDTAVDGGRLRLRPGEVRSVPVDRIERVAIGDPGVVDITIVSSKEVLLQAKTRGNTNLILWDSAGQRKMDVEVLDRDPAVVETQLRQLLNRVGIVGIEIRREDQRIFLVGDVPRQEDLDTIEQVLATFPEVTNLVTVKAKTVTVDEAPLVRLDVQVIEVSRGHLEELGINWAQSLSVTEPAVEGENWKDLFRFGVSMDRSALGWSLNALVQKNKARILSEPKLVTTSGKEAESFIGLEIPIITATSFGTTTSSVSASIQFRQTGVVLKMTPNVYGGEDGQNRRIATAINAEVSQIDNSVALTVPVGSSTATVPGFRVRKATTEVNTASGETILIAGLLEISDAETASQVPALGSVPFIGRLFRSPEIDQDQREIVIAVTPQILRDNRSPVVMSPDAAEFQSRATRSLEREFAERHPQPQGPAPLFEPAPAMTPPELTPEPLPEWPQELPPELPRAGIPDDALAESLTQAQLTRSVSHIRLSVDDTRLQYALDVQGRVAQGLQYPAGSIPAAGATAKLKLHLRSDGSVNEAMVSQTSGQADLDDAVVRAAQTQGPYPPFPDDLPEQELWLEIPVVFQP